MKHATRYGWEIHEMHNFFHTIHFERSYTFVTSILDELCIQKLVKSYKNHYLWKSSTCGSRASKRKDCQKEADEAFRPKQQPTTSAWRAIWICSRINQSKFECRNCQHEYYEKFMWRLHFTPALVQHCRAQLETTAIAKLIMASMAPFLKTCLAGLSPIVWITCDRQVEE